MYEQVDKAAENKSSIISNVGAQNKGNVTQCFGFVDNRPEAVVQRKLRETVNNSKQESPLQLKTRIANLDLANRKHRSLQAVIDEYKTQRQTDKNLARQAWIAEARRIAGAGMDEVTARAARATADDAYNARMEQIRAEHERKMVTLAGSAVRLGAVTPADVKNGNDFYGDVVPPVAPGDREIRQRPGGKAFVRDDRGTYIPRLVRRELGGDLAGVGAPARGDIGQIIDHDQLPIRGNRTHARHPNGGVDPVDATPANSTLMTEEDREFAQQSSGGGANTYAISHTATTGPILSNAHDSFGAASAGNLITDVANTQGMLRAQWEIGPGGSKVPLVPNTPADMAARGTTAGALRRGAVVTRSGYRNMEVLTGNIAGTDMRALYSGVEPPSIAGAEHVSAGGEELRAIRSDPTLGPGVARRDVPGPR